ncbi:CvpA family protein [Neorickettsia sennetsu]|uniref:CvpA family protein n=1 Tax=Ehrlichia sennetsu (strain ATCC VR-367 / Miyayama) TaxID=222891 RepID=Q2GCT7_EHRS3|nr:CvpA family protein [Neorickettsia sennetsu]ABD46163.1 CvpA family protein [Neorickettsia sennetsu str. Miyayama]
MFDLVLLFTFLLTILVGVLRGAIKEVFSAAVVVISVMVTYHNADIFLELFDVKPGPIVVPLSGVSVFITSFVILSLVNSWILYLISPVRLGPADRVLGGVFGVLRGIAYCYLLFAVLNIFYYALNGDEIGNSSREPGYYLPIWLKNAKSFSTLNYLDNAVNSLIPDEVFASLRTYSATFSNDSTELSRSDEKAFLPGLLDSLLDERAEFSEKNEYEDGMQAAS